MREKASIPFMPRTNTQIFTYLPLIAPADSLHRPLRAASFAVFPSECARLRARVQARLETERASLLARAEEERREARTRLEKAVRRDSQLARRPRVSLVSRMSFFICY
eukprot:1871994-Pleurochrysis_carterae.AAC.1